MIKNRDLQIWRHLSTCSDCSESNLGARRSLSLISGVAVRIVVRLFQRRVHLAQWWVSCLAPFGSPESSRCTSSAPLLIATADHVSEIG